MLPAFALAYGALLLSETLTWQKLVGLALILGGVGLGSGALRLPRRTAVAATP
jgi:drug/metabolite transporter (DMT)-like permease